MILIVFVLFQFVSGPTFSNAESSSPREYQVKAAFLYSIIKFVDWPNIGSTAAGTPLCVAVLGQDPFGDDIETIKGKSTKGRTITIKRFRRVEDVKGCDVLFISASERGHMARILKQLQRFPVLTIADQDGFCQAGGMINLVTVKNKVGFEINSGAAQRAQLRISSQLLKLAKIVIE